VSGSGPGSQPKTTDGVFRRVAGCADQLIGAGTLVILAVIALRVLTTALTQSTFDMDPVAALGPQPGITPAASLALDAVSLLGAAMVFAAMIASGRRVASFLLVLAALPIPVALFHAQRTFEDLWRGSAWCAAVIGAVALAHAVRNPGLRRAALAVLLGVVCALVVKGAGQILIEHPATIAEWDVNRAAFLAERGWDSDSAAARIFEERLRQAEASGWFGLANAFSTVMAATLITCAGLLIVGVRRHLPGGLVGVAALLAMGSGGLLLANGSKGALVATALGGAVLALGWIPQVRRRAVPLGLALVALAWLGVLARGLLLPEGFAGEKSLLFRFHYLADALRVIANHPLLGVGPSGFQDAMVAVRPPRHPEEVSSAHQAIIDWIVAFGPMGLAWGALLIGGLIAAGRAAGRGSAGSVGDPGPASAPEPRRSSGATAGVDWTADPARSARVLAALVALVGLVALWLEAPSLDAGLLVLRLAGVFGAAGATLALYRLGEWLDQTCPGDSHLPQVVAWSLFAAAIAVVIHVQIEMTLWLANAVGWTLAFCALAAPVPSEHSAVISKIAPIATRGPAAVAQRLAPAVAVILLCCGVVALLFAAGSAQRIEAGMQAASAPLEAIGRAGEIGREIGLRTGMPAGLDRGSQPGGHRDTGPNPAGGNAATAAPAAELVAELEGELRAAELPPATVRSIIERFRGAPGDWAIAQQTLAEALREERNVNRARAIDRLLELTQRSGRDHRPLLAAADEALRLNWKIDPSLRASGLRTALAAITQTVPRRDDSLRLRRRAAELTEALWLLESSGDVPIADPVTSANLVIAAWQEVLRRDPAALPIHRRLADIAERSGHTAVALESLERALIIDQELLLDPRKQLTDRDRAAIRTRIEALRGQQ